MRDCLRTLHCQPEPMCFLHRLRPELRALPLRRTFQHPLHSHFHLQHPQVGANLGQRLRWLRLWMDLRLYQLGTQLPRRSLRHHRIVNFCHRLHLHHRLHFRLRFRLRHCFHFLHLQHHLLGTQEHTVAPPAQPV